MGYLWLVKKLRKCCFLFETYWKQFVICDPKLPNLIPVLHMCAIFLTNTFLKNFGSIFGGPFQFNRMKIPLDMKLIKGLLLYDQN